MDIEEVGSCWDIYKHNFSLTSEGPQLGSCNVNENHPKQEHVCEDYLRNDPNLPCNSNKRENKHIQKYFEKVQEDQDKMKDLICELDTGSDDKIIQNVYSESLMTENHFVSCYGEKIMVKMPA